MGELTELVVHIPEAEGYGEKPGFDANLPADVRYDKNLSPMARLMYAEIRALSSKYGFCYAKNEYFVRVFDCDERSVKRWIKELHDQGYIEIYKARNDVNDKVYRIIVIAGSKIKPEKKGTKMSRKRGQKCPEKGDKNVTQGININNTNNINLKKITDSTRKVKNNFTNFEQREYTPEQQRALEEALLRPRIRDGDSS